MQHVLLIDNYDSFVHNLAHLVQTLGAEVTILRNDEVAQVDLSEYSHLLLSPGPGLPEEAGDLLPLIRRAAGQIPMLGVCLGHQAIAQCYGGTLFQHEQPLHGIEKPLSLFSQMMACGLIFQMKYQWVATILGLSANLCRRF